MDCRTFLDNHTSFVDGLTQDEELVAMQCHVAECGDCAKHDAMVRRALLLFRNMPTIEPSPEFAGRLEARLRAERRRQRDSARRAGYGRPRVGTFVTVAAGALAAGLVVFAAMGRPASTRARLELRPLVVAAPTPRIERRHVFLAAGAPPVLASDSNAPDVDPRDWSPLNDPAFAASVTSGMPMWPAAVLAAHAPAPLGSPQLKLTKLEQ
jgi:anti-sigma factor RsiW